MAHRIGAVCVNNRNLVTLRQISIPVSVINAFQGFEAIYISESAIFRGQDAALVAPYFNGFW